MTRVDETDLATWLGRRSAPAEDDPEWIDAPRRYVDANPRPTSGVAIAQRLALARRLAAGPADRQALLTALRTVGWVAANDLENRLRELRGGGRGTGHGLPFTRHEQQVQLTAPFAALDTDTRTALVFAKEIVGHVEGPMGARASAALDGLLPGLGQAGPTARRSGYRAGAATLAAFHAALTERRAVRVRYFSANAGRERTYDVVPVEYVPFGAVLKVVCAPLDADGQRGPRDLQLTLDRLVAVAPSELPTPAGPLDARRVPIVLEVSEGLYSVMTERDLLGIRGGERREVDVGVWRVTGSFPEALAWDVMEQLCAWAGNAQVHEPLWLVHAVCRRLRAGLAVMETSAPFELVKPEIGRDFTDRSEAILAEPTRADPAPRGAHGPATRLRPD